MARSALQQNSFSGGAISPRLFGRSDLAKYASSAEEIVNFIPRPEGGLMRVASCSNVRALKRT